MFWPLFVLVGCCCIVLWLVGCGQVGYYPGVEGLLPCAIVVWYCSCFAIGISMIY